MQCPDTALRFMIAACAFAGLRSGTAARLCPSHITDGHIIIATKKGQVTKTPVHPALWSIFGLAPEGSPTETYLKLLSGRNWVNPMYEIGKRWRKWKAKVGVRPGLGFHDLRRGLARSVYRTSGGDLRAVPPGVHQPL